MAITHSRVSQPPETSRTDSRVQGWPSCRDGSTQPHVRAVHASVRRPATRGGRVGLPNYGASVEGAAGEQPQWLVRTMSGLQAIRVPSDLGWGQARHFGLRVGVCIEQATQLS